MIREQALRTAKKGLGVYGWGARGRGSKRKQLCELGFRVPEAMPLKNILHLSI